MNFKKILTVAVLSASVFALSGCSLSRNVESLKPYAPSDGTQLNLENVKARNFLIVKGESNQALLIGSLVAAKDGNVTVQTQDGQGAKVEFSIATKAGVKSDIGYNGTEGFKFNLPAEEIAGNMYSVYLNDGTGPVELLVPIVDGTLEEYRPFADKLG